MKLHNIDPYKMIDPIEKKGVGKFLAIIFNNIANLLLTNFIFIISCIPIITIGSAALALTAVCLKMVRCQKVSVWKDYKSAFRENIKSGMVYTLTIFPVLILQIYIVFSNLSVAISENEKSTLFIGLFSLFLFLFTLTFVQYLFPMTILSPLAIRPRVKNSVILCFAGSLFSILNVLSVTAFLFLMILLFPKSIPILLLCFFSISSVSSCFFAWKIIDQFIFQKYYNLHPEEIPENYGQKERRDENEE